MLVGPFLCWTGEIKCGAFFRLPFGPDVSVMTVDNSLYGRLASAGMSFGLRLGESCPNSMVGSRAFWVYFQAFSSRLSRATLSSRLSP